VIAPTVGLLLHAEVQLVEAHEAVAAATLKLYGHPASVDVATVGRRLDTALLDLRAAIKDESGLELSEGQP
jgi:hypothetical protein